MRTCRQLQLLVMACVIFGPAQGICTAQSAARLPQGVKAVWDQDKAYRETTPTRERICINGLWRWQPAEAKTDRVPTDKWGYFKVPGAWPWTGFYMQVESQTLYRHPSWDQTDLAGIDMAWYQREFTVPKQWAGRRLSVSLDYLNSYAAVYVDGRNMGEVYFPGGEVEITSACRPGNKHVLSLYVVAMPLNAEIVSYADASGGRRSKGRVARRGLCGDVFLVGTPTAERLTDVKVETSVRKWEITFDAAFQGMKPNQTYSLSAQVIDNGRTVADFKGKPFKVAEVKDGRASFASAWKPDKLWDVHTPENIYDVRVSLLDTDGNTIDTYQTERFGFREFWIDGRDFCLNGSRFYCFTVPLDIAQVGPTAACYDGACESLSRLKKLGVNTVFTHNYGCLPGSHIGFAEILSAADDVGMLVSFSQPHIKDYGWKTPDADANNGYARHAEFYVRQAQNHPSVVMYSMNHNYTGYSQDMDPERIDGIYNPFPDPAGKSDLRTDERATLGRRAEAIVRRLDPTRVIYHHSSGNNGQMHTSNFYLNFVPIQERSDWFEHWATQGVKPVFLCEYGEPIRMTWTLHRGLYKGGRSWTNGKLPYEFCTAEWGSQFLGDCSYALTKPEKENLRWEAKQWRDGAMWYRWDYPFQISGTPALGVPNLDNVQAMYIKDNWRAYRTWGVSALNLFSLKNKWKLRDDVDKSRKTFQVDWDNLQKPGFSPDFIDERYERIDTAFELSDWIPTEAAKAFIRNNQPLLAYLGGKPARFTSKDHNFQAGETVEKQIIIINNSRETVTCDCEWSLQVREGEASAEPVPGVDAAQRELRPPIGGQSRNTTIETGEQGRIPLRFALPGTLAPGEYELFMTVKFNSGETQEDSFVTHVLPRTDDPKLDSKIAMFDPKGETAKLLGDMGVACDLVEANADLSPYSILLVGKGALTVDGAAPDIHRVRDGLKVVMFEQEAEVLEKRFGFRVQEYGLRRVFKRILDHPILAGLDPESLRDWRGEATIVPPHCDAVSDPKEYPQVRWCGIKLPRAWRAGCYGNVASVLIEKPAAGDFLPIVDGGFSLQYAPLLEYREGKGMVLFCQMDVTGRTEDDPAATRLACNLLAYASAYSPPQRRTALYAGAPADRTHFERAGVSLGKYPGGDLTTDQVLVVGTGGGAQLAPHKDVIASWLKAGGHVLAVGLDEADANAFLPFKVSMNQQEHMDSFFQPPGKDSLLAGVGPADVHNRDPRELPLVSGGATAVGNGVLAVGENANVVFWQLPPHTVTSAQGAVPSFVVNDDDAAHGQHSALVTMGSTTEWGGQFSQGLEQGGQVGKTYTFAVLAKGVGVPVLAHLEVERAGSPWDRAVRGEKVLIPEDKWTELHVTFKVEKPFAEGWTAYIACAQDGARFRADMFRLYEGEYVPWSDSVQDDERPRNLFTNPSFEKGPEPWRFRCREAQNLRITFRRASFLVSRLLANMGAAGETPLLSRFSTPPGGAGAESILKNGDFSVDADENGIPDHWVVHPRNALVREREAEDAGRWTIRVTCKGPDEDGKGGSVSLAQRDVSVEKDQWYRISFRAKSEGLRGARITLAIQDTAEWRSLFEYKFFSPDENWRRFTFLAPCKDTADTKTRFQVWHSNASTVWFSDMRIVPCEPPTQGRWLTGLYLDMPTEMDDPYRFFRW